MNTIPASLRTAPAATDRQRSYLLSLTRQCRPQDEGSVREWLTEGMTKAEASKLITKLLATKPEPQPVPQPEPATRTVGTCPDGCCGYVQDIATGQIIDAF